MSTEHQRYSIDNQFDVIRDYAAARGIEIVQTYTDPGRSGLALKNRPGLQQLLADVEAGPSYSVVLVYDVSRWGRFQDTDESAFYEHLCRRAGVKVTYCAEAFEDYDGAMLGIVKSIKRAMAAEYSRDLSKRVFRGQARVASMGFRPGSIPGYGLRRLVVSERGEPRQQLETGQHKAITTDRIVLVPGPENEIATVREIYRCYTETNSSKMAIARQLNAEGVPAPTKLPWSIQSVHRILVSRRYLGENIYNRTSRKLGGVQIVNDEQQWVRAPGAWQAIIDQSTFERAQAKLLARRPKILDDDELLERLEALFKREGSLSMRLIDEDPDLPDPTAVRTRLGGLMQIYATVGFQHARDDAYYQSRSSRRRLRDIVQARLEALLAAHGPVERVRLGNSLIFGGRTVAIMTLGRQVRGNRAFWDLQIPKSRVADFILAVRLGEMGEISDYWLAPFGLQPSRHMSLSPGAKATRTSQRLATLEEVAAALHRLPSVKAPR